LSKIVGLNGDEAVAYAAKQSSVDVVAAYPITPQTIIVEKFNEFVADGDVHTEFVCVESEHSAISASVGASLTGARVFSATASQGLALMHEILYLASSMRCPIVMGIANRALSSPINIFADHSDMMGSRDCGWVQIYTEDAQEAYDWIIQAFKIAEDPEILLPITVNLDGFTISHSTQDVTMLDDKDAKKFLPPKKIEYLLDPEKPMTAGAGNNPDYYYELKMQQVDAMKNVPKVIRRVNDEFKNFSGRKYGIVDTYKISDAEVGVMALGSVAGTAISIAEEMRMKGSKVGVIKPWLYRPFPSKEILSSLKNLDVLAVVDRCISFGAQFGPLCSDVMSLLYSEGIDLKILNIITGLGGRDITPNLTRSIFDEALEAQKKKKVTKPVIYLGVRG
jgi:pyruvate ferredoxin oxidoreductase alpha subunit